MSLGDASARLERAAKINDALDNGELRDVFGNLIEAVRLIGVELERVINPPNVPGTDFGIYPCKCNIRYVMGPGEEGCWMITPTALCPVEGHHRHLDDIVEMLPHG